MSSSSLPKAERQARDAIGAHLRGGGHLTLILDYDGTLVPIAPTPEEAMPDQPLLALLAGLVSKQALRIAVLSGRPLATLEQLLPVPGLLLCGLYGMEVRLGEQVIVREHEGGPSRALLDAVRQRWAELVSGQAGFLIEDKGRALALHARWADAEAAERVLPAARRVATELSDGRALRLLDGHRFLEVAPDTADKGQAVRWLLDEHPLLNDLAVVFGDDNKDEAAFDAVHAYRGLALGVGSRYALQAADVRLDSPDAVRDWLRWLMGLAPGT